MSRRGFTLVELLFVVLVVGLLWAIAVPQLRAMKERALVSSMKGDLRNFAMHEESYYYDRATYTDDIEVLGSGGFQSSAGVSISVNEATISGWSATAMHADLLVRCHLFIGDAAPVGAAVTEGIIDCG